MIAQRRIRTQMYTAILLLLVFVGVLSWTAFQGALQFRHLTKNLRERSNELPLVAKLSTEVNAQRALLSQCCSSRAGNSDMAQKNDIWLHRQSFQNNLSSIKVALDNYVTQLESGRASDPRIADISEELKLVTLFRGSLEKIEKLTNEHDWYFGQHFSPLESEFETLQHLTSSLPSVLKQRMDDFADHARGEYQSAMLVAGLISVCGIALLIYLAWSFNRALFFPLEMLLKGTREVASGNFDHRVTIAAEGEIRELVDAFNAMTHNFHEIKKDLNNQVQQRTKQVVRSEQMASVGFLAAGVAHEINNPLATIAWSAESLETRLLNILDPESEKSEQQREADIASMKKYLRRIQDEAFRCKGITHSLLDFSRLGDAQKSQLQLAEAIDAVIDMVKPLGRYRHRNVEFKGDRNVRVLVNPQEIKQVLLNLITNALDAIDEGGHVWVELSKRVSDAVLSVRDDGCGMTPEVRTHLFEPFFTRRRDGQGTGLGLSISYRIIEEHNGQIEVHSDGPGTGSTFIVSLPLYKNEQIEPLTRSAA
jgi:two-component system, NtrC family, sensor kinase